MMWIWLNKVYHFASCGFFFCSFFGGVSKLIQVFVFPDGLPISVELILAGLALRLLKNYHHYDLPGRWKKEKQVRHLEFQCLTCFLKFLEIGI